MNEVLSYMLRSCRKLCEETALSRLLTLDETQWQNYVSEVRGMIVTYPAMVMAPHDVHRHYHSLHSDQKHCVLHDVTQP